MNREIVDVICCEQCPTRWPVFDFLTPNQFKKLCESRTQIEYGPNEIIFKQGTPSNSVVFMVSGIGKIYVNVPQDHKRMIIGIVGQSRMIAGPGFFTNNTHTYTLTTLTNAKVCFIPKELILEFFRTNSKFAEGFMIDISQKALETFHKLISFSHKKMPGRLAEILLYLADEVYRSDEFNLHLSRQELGELSNMAKENVVRILKEFHHDGIITEKCPMIKILDKERLQKISESG